MFGASLEVAERSDPGRDPNKQQNEDAAGSRATRVGHLLVVCDGMGGHSFGQEASQLAVSTILQIVDTAPASTPPGHALVAAIVQAGRAVYQMGGDHLPGGRPGSTCVAVLVHESGAEIAHVGDSRVYFMRGGQIWQMTRDHSVVQQMIDRGAITPEQAVGHPEANKITRALGMKAETDVELREPVAYARDDIFVLASDGLCDLVRTDEIGAVIARAKTLDAACEELVQLANSRGGHDNITVQMAKVVAPQGGPPLTLPLTAPGPTLVEGALPEKTLVDPPVQIRAPAATHPFAPPALRPTDPPAHPALPSRGGCLVLLGAFALMGLILVAVVVWWFVKRP